jgi:enoyl-CoA hydratase
VVKDLVDVAVSARVATITLNRPDARNALNRPMLDALLGALDWFAATDEVDVGILAAVDPVFCAGLDLKELEPGGSLDLRALNAEGNVLPYRAKPLVGAINGAAVTGGLELALSCDVLVASDRARFADTHARVGILPFWGMSVRLPEAVGPRMANYMTLTGNFIDAETASRIGLVAMVVPHEELGAAAARVAADIAGADQAAVRAELELYREHAGGAPAEAEGRELDRSQAFNRRIDAEEIARRRRAIVERGRRQI